MAGLSLLLLIGFCIYAALLVHSTISTLSRPPRRTYAWAVSRALPGDPGELSPALEFEPFEFTSRDQSLAAWSVKGLNPSGPVAVLTHGWADSKVGALPRLAVLAPLCSRLIAWDLPAHGESRGRSTLGLREPEDLRALLATLAVAPERLLLCGWSLGAGVSLVVAAETPGLAAVIAEAPYRLAPTPARNVLRARSQPARFNLPLAFAWIGFRSRAALHAWTDYDRADHAARVACPLLIIRGSRDIVSPAQDARDIAARAPHARCIEIEGAGHNDLWFRSPASEQAAAAVRAFLSALPPAASSPASPESASTR